MFLALLFLGSSFQTKAAASFLKKEPPFSKRSLLFRKGGSLFLSVFTTGKDSLLPFSNFSAGRSFLSFFKIKKLVIKRFFESYRNKKWSQVIICMYWETKKLFFSKNLMSPRTSFSCPTKKQNICLFTPRANKKKVFSKPNLWTFHFFWKKFLFLKNPFLIVILLEEFLFFYLNCLKYFWITKCPQVTTCMVAETQLFFFCKNSISLRTSFPCPSKNKIFVDLLQEQIKKKLFRNPICGLLIVL